jgi:hypothetical protein
LNNSGAVFGFDLMYGLPGDSLTGFYRSLDFALALYPNHLDIFPLAVLPGTALAARVDAIGLKHLPAPPYTLISSPTFSTSDMQLAQQLASACDIFYTRGRAVAWFNGMLDALGQGPAEFLQRFGEWFTAEKGAGIREADLSDEQVWELQRAYLIVAFSSRKLKRFLPALLDLVDYHYHYAVALMTPPPEQVNKRITTRHLLQTELRRSETTRMATFSYEILDILETGAADVRVISDILRQTCSWALIYPTAEGVFTESVSELYFRLLEQLDGATPAGSVAERLGIPADEAREFLEFALAEGIVTPGNIRNTEYTESIEVKQTEKFKHFCQPDRKLPDSS